MPADHTSRSRPSSRPHPSSRSPPRALSSHHRSSDTARGRDADRDGRHSSHARRGDTSPSFKSSKGHESDRSRHPDTASSTTSSIGRNPNSTSASAIRGHFQNLSWTPDKGSRGGVAPSERRIPPSQTPNEGSSGTPTADQSKKHVDANAALSAKKEQRVVSPRKDGPSRAESNTKITPVAKKSDGSKAAEDRKTAPVKPVSSVKAAPAKPAVKFEMKAPTAPALARRTNPIQSTPKAPSRPSVFAASNGAPDDRHRRAEPPSPRGKMPPPRFPGSRYDDAPSSRRPSFPEDYRRESSSSHRSGYADPYPPSSHDRRPHDSRSALEPRHRVSQPYRDPKTLKTSKPRRKRLKKVLKKHVRVVLPSKSLPSHYAASDFVYYPRPDRTSVVGAGTYGKVFKAHNVYLNHCVALKTLPLVKPRRKAVSRDPRDKKRKRPDRWVKDGLHLTSLREIKLLKSISHQHDNVVGIREIFLEGPSCNLVFDYFEFDMHGIIYSAKVALPDAMTKDLVLQVFRGLDYLHTRAYILHRDIKAANILVGVNGQVRITDFGLAKQVRSAEELDSLPWYKKKFENSNRVITTPYRPPELLLGATMYGGEVDVWSGGCVLFEAFLKKLPFQGTGEDVDHLLTIWKILGLPDAKTYPEVTDLEWYWLFMTRVQPKRSIFGRLYKNKMSPQLYQLLQCIFQHNPAKRPTAAQILRHPFFTSESPLPKSAGSFLSTVEGEWHELEYKMIRDKEKAAVRRKHENKVILGYLQHKQLDHEQELSTTIVAEEIAGHQERIEFYKNEQEAFQFRLDAIPAEGDEETDQSRQVAEMKKSHGDMYMNATRRARYRGPVREKDDEKLLHEAWKWYEDENKKGNNPIPALAADNKSNTVNRSHNTSVESDTRQKDRQAHSMVKKAILSSSTGAPGNGDRKQSRLQRKRQYEARLRKHENHVARYAASKSRNKIEQGSNDKRSASSPLIDERNLKRARDD